MNLLGIRVQPQKVNFVVVDSFGEQSEIINSELLKIPAALDFPEKLKYVRNSVLDIISEYSIEIAGIRVAEGNSQNLNITRLHIEGVIQEAFSSSSVASYFVGRKSSIASRLSVSVKDLEQFFSGKTSFDLLGHWSELRDTSSREAALVAMGALG